MKNQWWVEDLRQQLETSDAQGEDEVEFTFARRSEWRAAEAQRGVAHELGEDYGYAVLRKRFEGEGMVWTFSR